ncbi:hypothetical protein WICPIJ_003343 [Wickerhamomyces pijperi]|uniref:Uncharacterized protein n=1 Tax=Wickerhamomyces pijperi TaxID=599730 RepID=A0A9P8TNZ0_WICPI|nr:hypothetical protein WICPIJ_003343 [Wickerhamomyces pijperi]
MCMHGVLMLLLLMLVLLLLLLLMPVLPPSDDSLNDIVSDFLTVRQIQLLDVMSDARNTDIHNSHSRDLPHRSHSDDLDGPGHPDLIDHIAKPQVRYMETIRNIDNLRSGPDEIGDLSNGVIIDCPIV